jgi:hypothetical protein
MPKPFGQSCTWASASYPMPISSNLPNVHVSGQGSRNRLPPSPNILEHDKVLRLLGFTNRILSYLMEIKDNPRGLLLAISPGPTRRFRRAGRDQGAGGWRRKRGGRSCSRRSNGAWAAV